MQSMPLLFRQTLRTSLNLTRSASSSTQPLRKQLQLQFAPAGPRPSPFSRSPIERREFSVCLQCQFRERPVLYSYESDKSKDTERDEKGERKDGDVSPEDRVKSDGVPPEEGQKDKAATGEGENVQRSEQSQNRQDVTEGQGLPSSVENRRSQWSRQFTTMMDNLQSNIFVAGQRLNDLTGYSAIETLKNEIHAQEDRLRAARAHVRDAKNNYTAAINRRSTSQREVNELLQRKHAWSSADLERFTHLYRNDHANEVAENEAQEAFSVAEREAEEAAANLSKSILSRYHEEQVWSDKIRRMSTWGTWGLMGVNVLLFLIFQIAVEPWRRSRLVKGFEEKVLEALEKNNAITAGEAATARAQGQQDLSSAATQKEAPASHDSTSIPEATESIPPANESPTADTPALEPSSTGEPTPNTTTTILETSKSHLSRLPSLPSASVESWRNTLHELFSDRNIAITQRDLTTVAIQSAAAGAAVMGLVIALIRPR
ncbi:hypothetical protein PHISCL_08877 [Aspergillus sclerotialis]|uniref:Sensitive to high expression protein 9, mitochondrial n=1 Tax=Aspergillus sclerotialis TaxID=2070753 RepID=A0A3A2ZBV7_9EURO|nr:hypothetical protein PHISCL_08877 [Aspergillus sclerotialis]